MASIFDILKSQDMGAVLSSLAKGAGAALNTTQNKAPGGLGNMVGAGALGTVLGSVLSGGLSRSGGLLKNAGLLGAGAVAWNFYKKWAAQQQQQQNAPTPYQQAGYQGQPYPYQAQRPAFVAPQHNQFGDAPLSPETTADPAAELVMRAMIFAARSDGNIDAEEHLRMHTILRNMLPECNIDAALQQMQQEPIDPSRLASQVQSLDQAEDLYRLSCAVIDVDHFSERGYLDALAQTLRLPDGRKEAIEAEATQARRELTASLSQPGFQA